eukprot:TRINITY_DN1620_c0_g1_i4.p1 TRINITY_DN1620_c0_g1~~TRINITY_DN1620_c0_g1_i4.p1  ORF type:complete len:710 (+),score=219.36 TRINITY_DN1620_c0_g1_i4:56-2131(+)
MADENEWAFDSAVPTARARSDGGETGELMKGYLLKLGARWKTWKRRWFVVQRNSSLLQYFKAPDEKLPMGAIDLAHVTAVEQCDTKFANIKKEKGEWAFQFVTADRIYYLVAPDESTMKYWIDGVRKLVSEVQDGGCSSMVQNAQNVPEDVREEMERRPYYGQLFVNIKEATGLPLSKERGHLGVYCVLTLEKQMVKTNIMSDFANVRWNEGFFFDVTQLERMVEEPGSNQLVIALWAQDISRSGGQFLGQLGIPMSSVCHQKPVDRTFKLQGPHGAKPQGQLHLKLLFTNIYEKVGLSDFEMLKVVGRGNFGKVMQVRKKDTGRIYAMKILKKETVIAADAVQHTLSESNVLKRMAHPFIVNLKYSFQTSKKLYMVLDYLSGGELFYHLSNLDRFSEDRARFYAAEIVSALGYLHKNDVLYRDLKPENLLLDITGHVCLTDFGLVKEGVKYGDKTYTFCGSPEYLAPEILQNKGYARPVDWWALGTFLYEMLEGLPPFYDEDIMEMNRKILAAPLYFDPDHFSPEAKSLLRGLLQRDPQLRLGSGPGDAEEIKAHPFFRNVDWGRLERKEYEPEFKPHLQSLEDVRYFDPEFTSQTVQDTPVDDQMLLGQRPDLFKGFSYVCTSSFEQLIKQRRKMSQQKKITTPSEGSTDGAGFSESQSMSAATSTFTASASASPSPHLFDHSPFSDAD